jgi:hypothetical protein
LWGSRDKQFQGCKVSTFFAFELGLTVQLTAVEFVEGNVKETGSPILMDLLLDALIDIWVSLTASSFPHDESNNTNTKTETNETSNLRKFSMTITI